MEKRTLEDTLTAIRNDCRQFNALTATQLCMAADLFAKEFGAMLTAFQDIAAAAESTELLKIIDQCRLRLEGTRAQWVALADQIREQV